MGVGVSQATTIAPMTAIAAIRAMFMACISRVFFENTIIWSRFPAQKFTATGTQRLRHSDDRFGVPDIA
jgi:hypothetical protein